MSGITAIDIAAIVVILFFVFMLLIGARDVFMGPLKDLVKWIKNQLNKF